MGERGWRFPVEADPVTGKICEVTGSERIRQSISAILTTSKGERPLQPEFGCDLYAFMFSQADYTTLKQIEREVRQSLKKWQKEIVLLDVRAQTDAQDPAAVNVEVLYKVPGLEAELSYNHKVLLKE